MSSHSGEHASELRALFFQGAQELLQALNEQGLALEHDPTNAEAVGEVRRIVHTLKGDSAACGFAALSDLAHELEDVLAPEIAAVNSAALPEVVLSAADMFDAMCAAYRADLEPPNGDPLRALIWKMAQQPAAGTRLPNELKPSFSWTEYERLAISEAAGRGLRVYQIAAAVGSDCPMRAAAIAVLRKVLQEAGTLLACSPDEAQWPEAHKVEFVLSTEHDRKWLTNNCRVPGVVAQLVIEEFVPALELTHEDAAAIMATAPSSVAPSRAASVSRPADHVPDGAINRVAASAESTLRVDAERVDNLLNLVVELVIG